MPDGTEIRLIDIKNRNSFPFPDSTIRLVNFNAVVVTWHIYLSVLVAMLDLANRLLRCKNTHTANIVLFAILGQRFIEFLARARRLLGKVS